MGESGSDRLVGVSTGASFDRSLGIGGSDIAAIAGLSKFRSAFDVWAEKVGHPSATQSSGLHLRFGAHLEPFVASEYERVTGWQTHTYERVIRSVVHPHLYGHIDRFVTGLGQACTDESGSLVASTILECKTANAFSRSSWGEEWTDQVPAAYLVQCVWYMALTLCESAHLAVLIGNNDFRIYCISRDKELEQLLIDIALKFWDEHVLTGHPPEISTRGEALSLFPKSAAGVELVADDQMLSMLRRLKTVQSGIAQLTEEADQIKDAITSSMGEAERITFKGQTLASWKNVKPSTRIDVARMRRERPDLASEFALKSEPTRRFMLEGN